MPTPITVEDNASIANVIRQVSAEYGLTADKGYSVADPTLDDLFSIYSQVNAAYWVVEHQGKIVGGGGFSALAGVEGVCELQKMYFLPICRGQGLAKQIVSLSRSTAKKMGYQRVINAVI
nr:GNAT family N-acetyltransferase [Vibrio vulnificus]